MRYTIESIREEAKEKGWGLLSVEYINLNNDLTFFCPEGHKVFTSYGKWRKKQECPVCNQNNYKQMDSAAPVKKKRKGDYRVVAFDQASHVSGYAVFNNQELISYGAYESTKSNPLERIVDMCDWMLGVIKKYNPDLVGFEDIQYTPQAGMGHDTFKLLGQVMGAAMLTAAREHVKVEIAHNKVWRSHCKVKGVKRADMKKSAQLLVKQWYDISVTNDESDAICMGKYFSDNHKKQGVIIGEWLT